MTIPDSATESDTTTETDFAIDTNTLPETDTATDSDVMCEVVFKDILTGKSVTLYTVPKDTKIALPTCMFDLPEGMIFDGWERGSDSKSFAELEVTDITESVVFYAKWISDPNTESSTDTDTATDTDTDTATDTDAATDTDTTTDNDTDTATETDTTTETDTDTDSENDNDKVKFGDVNNDGKITAKDGMLIQRYAVHLIKLDDNQLKAADVNFDGKVTNKDALAILRFTIGYKVESLS